MCECSLMYESEPKQFTTNFVLPKQLYNHSHCFMFICVGRTVAIRLSRSGDYEVFLQLAVEAALDWVFYESSNLVRLSVIPTGMSANKKLVYI